MKPDASQAIAILSQVREQLGPQYLSYWVLPNTILTLSGARAFCDGVFWDDAKKDLLRKWDHEIDESMEIIKKSTEVVWSSSGITEVRNNEKYAGYDLILETGLDYVLAETALLHNLAVNDLRQKETGKDFSNVLVANLKSQSRFDDYSDENLRHIAFGILVGYPDKAILESVNRWQDEADVSGDSLVDASIDYSDYYICPRPVYSYPQHLSSDPRIIANEKLWSSILQQYYTSDFHQSLEQENLFNQKMQELGNLK